MRAYLFVLIYAAYLPLALLTPFAGAMLWQLALPGGLIRGLPAWLSRPAGEVREGWLEGPGGLPAGRGGARAASPSVVQVLP